MVGGAVTTMPSMTTEQRIQSCYERIQALETRRTDILGARKAPEAHLLNPMTDNTVRIFAANFLQHTDEVLIQLYNQQKALRNLAEHLQALLVQHPRPVTTSQ